ncbi:FecCD family ABC transporter permease [Bacillus chungangensis]|uniref:Iron complex transport system permease protein n=1 Tax=Bacillus chungangensis TaxID=587633 RepID=A0ABT9WYJ0_9BACI|nr:iron ABC transporter permease [Bacillus chungangensis]MDQ0178358.1 iron complex transport system permease protein [Bacillus chungangensis]
MKATEEKKASKEEKKQKHPLARRRLLFFSSSTIIVVLVVLYALRVGAVSFTTEEVWSGFTSTEQTMARKIVWDLRVPRVVIGLMVGMSLSIAGSLLQGVMKNPLADPGIIGVSSGAGLVATIIMILFPQHALLIPGGAFLGAFITAMLIYLLAWQQGANPMRIILVGIAVNAVIGAVMSAIMLLYSDRVQAILPWLAGGISGVGWNHVNMICWYVLLAFVLSFFSIKHIRILMLGDEVAKLLGNKVERSRFFLIVVSTLLAGIAVSVSGLIGFVGLVVPHIMRLIVGNDYRYLLPASAIGGAILLVLADTIARSWFDPIELPVGILLSFLGGPFFLFIIRKGGKRYAAN